MIVEKAFKLLYPYKEFNYFPKIRYSGKFSGYNGNLMLKNKELTISMSKYWQDVDDEIKIGLIQVLLNKLLKTSVKTINIDLYNNFLSRVHISIKKTKTDLVLEASFNRVNNKYLDNNIEMPNLKWGHENKRKLGSYEYGEDMIMISSILKDAPLELIDLVMYHEVLHKKHKFKSGARKSSYHTKEFKNDEKRFEDFENTEKRLNLFLSKKRIKKWFFQ